MNVRIWCPEDERGVRVQTICEAFGVELADNHDGMAVWALADAPARCIGAFREKGGPAIDYREYDYPDEFTLCFGPNHSSAGPMVDVRDGRVTIPGLGHSLYADQAMAVILEHLRNNQ